MKCKRKTILHRLKCGIITYNDVHSEYVEDHNLSVWSIDHKDFISECLDKKIYVHPCDILDDIIVWEQICHDPYIVDYMSKRYCISENMLMVVFSSSQWKQHIEANRKIGISNNMHLISSAAIWNKFIELLLSLLYRLDRCKNMALLDKCPVTWLLVYKFVSANGLLSDNNSFDRHYCYQAKFPFSWYIIHYLETFVNACKLSGFNYAACDTLSGIIDLTDIVMVRSFLLDLISFTMGIQCTADVDSLNQYIMEHRQSFLHCCETVISHRDILLRLLCDQKFKIDTLHQIFDLIFFPSEEPTTSIQILSGLMNDIAISSSNINKTEILPQLIALEYLANNISGSARICKEIRFWKYLLTNTHRMGFNVAGFSTQQCSKSKINELLSIFEVNSTRSGYYFALSDNLYEFDLDTLVTFMFQEFKPESSFSSTVRVKMFVALLIALNENYLAKYFSLRLISFATACRQLENVISYTQKTVDDLLHSLNEIEIHDLIKLLRCFLGHFNQPFQPDVHQDAIGLISSNTTINPESKFISALQEIIRKRVIEEYPQKVLNSILSCNDNALVSQRSSSHQKLFCLKAIVRMYGTSFLNSVKEDISWLLDSRTSINKPNLFNIVGDSFACTRKAILEPQPTFAFSQDIVLMNYFHFKVYCKTPSNTEDQLFRSVVNKVLECEQRAILLKLDNGELFGCPVSKWSSNISPLFLLYCFLQNKPSNTVTMFLSYIHNYPIRISKMFLPTMREDVVSKFRDTLGEKFAAQGHHLYTWYQCENKHIYAINNCGEPLETGKCFCGGDIGGVKHNLAQGNRRVEGYNFTEEGYNLAPICLQNSIDSERKLNGLSLSFMRWMLHAALVSSPLINQCNTVFGMKPEEDLHNYLNQRIEQDFKGIRLSLKCNEEDTLIWMFTAIVHIFSATEPTSQMSYNCARDRNQLEDLYLEVISPLTNKPSTVVSHGQDVVYSSDDVFIRQVLGLTYPKDGESLYETEAFLHFRTSAITDLELQFTETLSPVYPVTANFLTHRKCLDLLGYLPRLVRLIVKLLQMYNHKITEHELETTLLVHCPVITDTDIALWNYLWATLQDIPQLVDNIHISDQHRAMRLDETSKLGDIMPTASGRGACSWYMINALVAFNNLFATATTRPINVVNLASLDYGLQDVQNNEMIAVIYDSRIDGVFDFEQLEVSLADLLNVPNRIQIDTVTCKQLLFHPLKQVKTWHQFIKQLPKNGYSKFQQQSISTYSVTEENLRSLEIMIQVTSSSSSKLSISDACKIYQLELHPLHLQYLYYSWHEHWYQLSQRQGSVHAAREVQLDTDLSFDACASWYEVTLLPLGDVLRILHMLVVEWVLHHPGFDPTGMQLKEALDFFSEQANVFVSRDTLDLIPDNVKVEHSIQLWNMFKQLEVNLTNLNVDHEIRD